MHIILYIYTRIENYMNAQFFKYQKEENSTKQTEV